MHRSLRAAGLLFAGCWAAPAPGAHAERHPIPYVGAGAALLITDGARRSDDGIGLQLSFGMPFDDHQRAIELRFLDIGYRRPDGRDNYQSSLFVDYVHNLGVYGRGDDELFAYVKPFASAGIGLLEEDANNDKHIHLGFALGAGAIAPLGYGGWTLRLDARAQPQVNNVSIPDEDYLLDYAVGLTIQVPLTPFRDHAVALAPPEDCPVKVVGLGARRSDCVTDSDGDGVRDGADVCPGSAAGAAVDRKGCPTATRSDRD